MLFNFEFIITPFNIKLNAANYPLYLKEIILLIYDELLLRFAFLALSSDSNYLKVCFYFDNSPNVNAIPCDGSGIISLSSAITFVLTVTASFETPEGSHDF